MKLNCVQVNLKKALVAAIELNKNIKNDSNTVGFITEPYVSKGKLSCIPPGCYTICGVNPRAALICSHNSGIIALEQFTHSDIAVGLYQKDNEKVLLASVYLDIKKEVIQDWLNDLINLANKKKYGILILSLIHI